MMKSADLLEIDSSMPIADKIRWYSENTICKMNWTQQKLSTAMYRDVRLLERRCRLMVMAIPITAKTNERASKIEENTIETTIPN